MPFQRTRSYSKLTKELKQMAIPSPSFIAAGMYAAIYNL